MPGKMKRPRVQDAATTELEEMVKLALSLAYPRSNVTGILSGLSAITPKAEHALWVAAEGGVFSADYDLLAQLAVERCHYDE